MLRRLGAWAAIGLWVAGTACSVNPATGRREFMLVSESQEIGMGREADPQIVAQFGLYPDSALQRYVRDLGMRLAAVSERPHLPWTFRVLDDPIVNAFALPGGFNYVTRGIMVYFESEAELAAVMGHELGHVTARHGAAQMSQQQLFAIPIAVGAIALPRYETVFGIAAAGMQLLFLKFSRDDEREADALGLRYMSRIGYDPGEAPHVFEMLALVSGGGGDRLPSWLSTHPDPEDRAERLRARIAELPPPVGTAVRRAEYLRTIDGMIFGENPREGYFKDGVFYHPDLAFSLAFPSGWRTANQRSAVLAQSPDQAAVMRLRLADADSPEAAARAFAGQRGVSAGPLRRGTTGGFPSAALAFTASAEDGELAGVAVFLAYTGRVYEILGVGSAARWPAYRAPVERAIASFAQVTDRAVLDVQPLKLRVVALDRPATLAELAARPGSPVDAETLGRLNRLPTDQRLPAGRLVKQVVGSPLP